MTRQQLLIKLRKVESLLGRAGDLCSLAGRAAETLAEADEPIGCYEQAIRKLATCVQSLAWDVEGIPGDAAGGRLSAHDLIRSPFRVIYVKKNGRRVVKLENAQAVLMKLESAEYQR